MIKLTVTITEKWNITETEKTQSINTQKDDIN